MSGWQPERYDPQLHQQRLASTAPQPASDQSWARGLQPPRYEHPYPPQGHQPPSYGYAQYGQPPAQPPRKKRRVFMWVFIAVQVLFIIWLATGIASAPSSNNASAAATAAKFCAHGGWSPLYSSQAQCLREYGNTLKDAGDTGTAIGAALIVVVWCVVDFLMGITYLIVRLAGRPARA